MKYWVVLACMLTACQLAVVKKPVTPIQERDPLAPLSNQELAAMPESRRLFEASHSFYQEVLIPAGFSGGMLVAYRGKVVFEAYAGREKINQGDAMDSSSALHLASVSKTFTAMAVLKLQEQGLLDIMSPAFRYLPEFPYPEVRVIDLLNHRSGIPNYIHFMESLGWDTQRVLTNRDLLYFIVQHRDRIHIQRANKHFEYSNTNYALLALIIEHASGIGYAAYLNEHFFRPLGMHSTYVFQMDKSDQSIPSFDHRGQQESFTWLDAVYGDKNIYSTPRDLYRWDRALSERKLFLHSTLELAYKGYSFERPGVRNYGLGWRLYDFPNGSRLIFHNGWWHGNNIVFGRLPKDSATVIVLGNRYTTRIYEARKLYAGILGLNMPLEDDE